MTAVENTVWFSQFPGEGRMPGSQGHMGKHQDGSEVRGWGRLWTKPLLWSPQEGTEEAEWAASGLACLVSLSRLWGVVTLLVVWYLALGPRLGQVDSGLEGKSSTKEGVSCELWIDWLVFE